MSGRRASAGLVAWLASLAIVVGCGGGGATASPASSASPGGSASAAPSRSAPAAASPSLPSGEFRNPVIADDFPDPFVLKDGDTYYAYATTDVAQNLQLARSPDLVHWEELGDPLPTLPGWSPGDTWAPEVYRIGGRFVMYYTARDFQTHRPDGRETQCVTRAVADTPEGPFVDDSDGPLVCQADLGGSIDATYFADDGTGWLIWKNDGNCCGLPTRFFIQRLSDDGLSLEGEPTDMGVVNDAGWEGALIEAPALFLHNGTYYLFYSANGYDTEFYAVGYATSKTLEGPYADAPENPILASPADPAETRARGPGHQSIVADDDGDLWMAYHAWDEAAVGYANFGQRSMWIDPLVFEGGKPVVKGPDDDPQPVP